MISHIKLFKSMAFCLKVYNWSLCKISKYYASVGSFIIKQNIRNRGGTLTLLLTTTTFKWVGKANLTKFPLNLLMNFGNISTCQKGIMYRRINAKKRSGLVEIDLHFLYITSSTCADFSKYFFYGPSSIRMCFYFQVRPTSTFVYVVTNSHRENTLICMYNVFCHCLRLHKSDPIQCTKKYPVPVYHFLK